jgi:hypothetical protein
VERAPGDCELRLAYQRRDFRRALVVRFAASAGAPMFVGSQVVFDLVLEPHVTWHCSLEAIPELDGRRLELREPAAARAAATTIAAASISIGSSSTTTAAASSRRARHGS